MRNFLLVLGLLLLIGIAGSFDYTEEVVYNMPTSTYKAMKEMGMKDKKIASEYQKNKAKWDSVGANYAMIHGEED